MRKIAILLSLLLFSFCSGAGTPADPYLISDCYELQNISSNLSAYYALSNDIDCSVTRNWNWNETEGIYNGFIPIGPGDFDGDFDGRNFTIKSLHINQPDKDYVGLFGRTSPQETLVSIRNIGLINVNITGNNYVGGLSGRRGRIQNSYSTGTITGNNYVGGLVGSTGEIQNSYFAGTVIGNDYVGGLIGYNNGVFNSFFKGNVVGNNSVGGLIGYYYRSKSSPIQKSYSTGNIVGLNNVGGLIGTDFGGHFDGYHFGKISDSYSTAEVIGETNVGGLIGHIYNDYYFRLVTNTFYYNRSENPLSCVGKFGAPYPSTSVYANCTAIPDSAHPPYFYLINNSPMNTWDFKNAWSSANGFGYPFLKNLPNPYAYEGNSSLLLFPSISYNRFENKIKILVYAYDPTKGEEVTSGVGSYKISNLDVISSGELSYNSRWFGSKELVLAPGDYVLEVNINNNVRNVEFKVVEGTAVVSGSLKDYAGVELEGVLVEMFKFNNFPDLSYSFTMADKSYSFEIEPGEYIIRAKKGTMESVMLAFSVFGDQEIIKDIILSEEKNLQPAFFDLKESFLSKMNKEASMMAELTEWARADLGSVETEALREIAKNILLEGSEGIDISIISEFVKSKSQAFKYKAQLDNLSSVLRDSFLEIEDSSEVLNAFEWLALSDENGRIPERTSNDLKNTPLYKKSLQSLNNFYNFPISDYSEDFDFSKARKVVGDQITQLEGLYSSKSVHLLPDSDSFPFSWTFIGHYDNYAKAHADLLDAEKTKEVGFSVSVAAGVVTGVITGLTASLSGPGAVVAGTAVGVATFTKMQAALVPFNYVIDGVSVVTSMIAGQSYVFAASEWTLDIARAPGTYMQIISFLEDESQEPYYLNKDNDFDSEVQVNIYPDEIEGGKGIFYLATHPYSSGLTGNSVVMRNASVSVRNLYTPSSTRVFSQTQLLEDSGWGNNKKRAFSFLGGSYFSANLSQGEEITKEITLQAVEKSFTMDAQILVVQVFSGPFQTAVEKEYFLIVPKIVNYLQYSKEPDLTEIKSMEIPVREKQKQLTIQNYLDYAQNVFDIKDNSAFKSNSLNSFSDGKIILSRENPEFEFEYDAGNLYGAEFHLFHPAGTDVDLYVYEGESYIGFNQIAGTEEIGFPGTYSGKRTMPEVIYIPQVKDKNYKVRARLVKENSDMPVPIKISVLEEPFRPALLSVHPPAVDEVFLKGEKFNLSFLISEIGGQKPLENVTAELEIQSINYSEYYSFERINAGSGQEIAFEFSENKTEVFSGKLKIDSSAGYIEVGVSIQIKEFIGDTNNDCSSSLLDLAKIGKSYDSSIGESGWDENADLNKDQKINLFDLLILEEDYGKEC